MISLWHCRGNALKHGVAIAMPVSLFAQNPGRNIKRSNIMFIRTLAASIVAFGLLSPAVFAGDNDYCSTNQAHRSDYPPCNFGAQSAETQGLAVRAEPSARNRGTIGNFIDETTEERNQRSSNH
jgi:hypothetical protein